MSRLSRLSRIFAKAPTKRVFFHVGAPKTGTTFVQDLLWHSRDQLASEGVLYPLEAPRDYIGATMDICNRAFGGRWDPEWTGAWSRVATATRQWNGDRVVFSGELMGLATRKQARRTIRDVQPAEVHLIYTARDFGRQLPSDWQEQVKHRHTVTFSTFVEDLVARGLDAPAPFGELFWGLHDGAYVLGKWRGLVPPNRIHVITVPQPSAPPGLLWQRFASVLGLDAHAFDTSWARQNRAMGLTETEFMRRFSLATRDQLTYEHGPVINRVLGQDILGERAGSVPIRLPKRYHSWVTDRSARLIRELERAKYDVVGDLNELLPVFDEDDQDDQVPEKLPPIAMNKVAYDATAGLIDVVLGLRARVRRLSDELDSFSPGRSAAIEHDDGEALESA